MHGWVLLLLPCVAALTFVLAVLGWAQLRSSGLEPVALELGPQAVRASKDPVVTRVIDALGAQFERPLLRLYGARRRHVLDQRLDAAGRPEGLTERDYVRRKAGYLVLGIALAVLFVLMGQPFLGVVLVALCAVWMDVWLRAVIRNRRRQIARELPDFLDIVAVTVGAGLSLQGALERVASSSPSVLSKEVLRTLDDMRYGLGRRQALERLRARNDVESLSTFVTAILQAEELGTPLSRALIDIAAEVRREFAQAARQSAARAAPKVSLVVSMTIVPGAMVLIIAGFVLANLPKLSAVFGG
jgi:tight adherence protein C